MTYSKEFLRLLKKVSDLKVKLASEEKLLRKTCPHVHLDGRTAFPAGPSFQDCSLCGMSNYYLGKENKL